VEHIAENIGADRVAEDSDAEHFVRDCEKSRFKLFLHSIIYTAL